MWLSSQEADLCCVKHSLKPVAQIGAGALLLSLYSNCHGILSEFLFEVRSGGLPATKLCPHQQFRYGGTCKSRHHKYVSLTLDAVDQLVGSES